MTGSARKEVISSITDDNASGGGSSTSWCGSVATVTLAFCRGSTEAVGKKDIVVSQGRKV